MEVASPYLLVSLGVKCKPCRAAEIHSFKFGVDYRKWRHNITQLFFGGQYDFSKPQRHKLIRT